MCRWSAQIRGKKAEIQAFRDSYSKDGYDLMITIEGTRIRSYKNNAPDVDLRKKLMCAVYFETETFLRVPAYRRYTAATEKDAFIKGDVEACRELYSGIKEKIYFFSCK